jgi:hypothetical protein
MTTRMNRREFPAFLAAAPLAAAGTAGKSWEGFPRQEDAWVKEVVGAAHSDLARVRAVVEAHPTAANAAFDWGFGDWETPLGAAAHTGRREIAEYLLEKGARLDLFAAAMLGWTEVVKGIVESRPGIEATLGPHGIPLLAHARAGGAKARETLAYLETLPAAGRGIPTPPLADERRKVFVGTYEFDGGRKAEIKLSSPSQLSITVENMPPRWIHHAGNEAFYPAGAPRVRIEFDLREEKPVVMRIVDGPLVVTATRIG